MIARLRGILLEAEHDACVLDVGGVGYDLLIPVSTFEKLPRPGDEAVLFVHTQVREDAVTLFGFFTAAERSLFRLLLGVSGIGGKLALSVLSTLPVSSFCSAVNGGDAKLLSRIPGIGKRTAERMIVELRGKLDTYSGGSGTQSPPGGQAVSDAVLALENLGFKHDAVDCVMRALLAEIPSDSVSAEELVRQAVVRLSR